MGLVKSTVHADEINEQAEKICWLYKIEVDEAV